jgi:Uma2 family endonuclease
MNIQQYLSTPETAMPHELAFGNLRVSAAPSVPHQRAVGRLFLGLDEHVRTRRLGEVYVAPVDVILDVKRHLVVQPDLLFLSEARNELVLDKGIGAPELVIEVLSPRPRVGTLTEHIVWFPRYGVQECWLVNITTRVVDVLTFDDGRVSGRTVIERFERIRSRVLPEFDRTLGSMLGY